MRPRATPNNPCLPLPRPGPCPPAPLLGNGVFLLFYLCFHCWFPVWLSCQLPRIVGRGHTAACWAQFPGGRAVRLCSTRPGAPPVHPGGRRGQLKAGSLGALPGETASPPSPEHCEQSWRCHPLPHSLLTPTARFGLQHVEARPTAVQAVLRPLSPAPCGHQSLCGSLLCFPLEGQLPVGRGRCNPGCIPTSARCLVTT